LILINNIIIIVINIVIIRRGSIWF